jgi:hypothetical protein
MMSRSNFDGDFPWGFNQQPLGFIGISHGDIFWENNEIMMNKWRVPKSLMSIGGTPNQPESH